MRRLARHVVGLLGATLLVGLAASAAAESRQIRLGGFDEVPVVITDADGTLRVSMREDSIEYVLRYERVEGTVTQAHIHLGQRHTTGSIVVFLCTNLGNAPAPAPACPASPATVTGTITPDDVITLNAQGVGPGDLEAVIRAIREGVAYANVHTDISPSGAIRGQFFGKH
jgi:hypothetical protein